VADKLGPGDKSTLENAVNETIKWLDAVQEGSKEEYSEKQKELEAIADPIMQNCTLRAVPRARQRTVLT
jgi:L1 cell adhesion molecule like protein